ncbi:MAG: hypothetical protein MMC33_008736 [Icmadophila ericetorum]|nr:hypothetical protein [Icmadophila ericetorum]
MPFLNGSSGGAIELQAETNPLNERNLYNTLVRASSTNPQQVQTGTQQLQNWEKESYFYATLQTILIDLKYPVEVRYLAVIQLKNGIDKYWRKTATNAIIKEEKALIRSRALESGIKEPDHRLALQTALAIAKITRFDFPHDWPDAISSITQHLRLAFVPGTNPIYLPRSLLMLLYVVKELATGRLIRTRTNLQSATPEVFQVLGTIYITKVQSWLGFIQNGGDNEGGALNSIEHSLLSLRVLRRLFIAGYEFPNRNKDVHELWILVNQRFGEILSLVSQHSHLIHAQVRQLIEKHLVQTSKLHHEMVKTHPAAFVLLPHSIDLAKSYWSLLVEFGRTFGSQTTAVTSKIGTGGGEEEEEEITPCVEKLSLKALLLLRATVKLVYSPTHTFKYQHAEDKEERKLSVENIKSQLLSDSLIREMMETLVTRFFVFRPKDLREWEEEPEEWERREEGEGDAWEFSARSCAEKLFLDLVINNKALLIEPLLSVFSAVATTQNTDILLKDSIYAAIGLAAPVLDQHLDFARFLETTLVPEVQIQQPGYKILRRRITMVLGQWLPIKEGLNRPLVYQIFQYLLDKSDESNDEVVRVTAGRQLKNIIDPFEFKAEDFMPFATTTLSRLMALIEEVELAETKMALLNTISVIVVKMERHITPFADQIISLLPPLWTQAGDVWLMKQSILTILAALITSMKTASVKYHSMIIPLIQSCLDPTSDIRQYLLEDALDLWGALLIQSPGPTEDILSLAQFLFPLFETATDALRKSLEITESYFLLAPRVMLQTQICTNFSSAFSALLDAQLKREANGMIMHLVKILIHSAESLGGVPAVQSLTNLLLEARFLSKLVTGLRTAFDAHQTTGPNRIHSDIDGIVETDYFSVLASLALSHPPTFISAISTIATGRHESFPETIAWLLTEWFSHLDNISSPPTKKLMCMALTALADPAPEAGPQAWILGKLQDLVGCWTELIAECMESDEDLGRDEDEKDNLVYEEKLEATPYDSPEDVRKREFTFTDPVHRIPIKQFIREHLHRIIGKCGGQEAFQRDWLGNVDEDVIKDFANYRVL